MIAIFEMLLCTEALCVFKKRPNSPGLQQQGARDRAPASEIRYRPLLRRNADDASNLPALALSRLRFAPGPDAQTNGIHGLAPVDKVYRRSAAGACTAPWHSGIFSQLLARRATFYRGYAA